MSSEPRVEGLPRIERAVVGLSRLLAIAAAGAIVVVMLSTALNVVVRFTSRATVPGTLEVAQSCLVIAVFFGLAWAGITGDHVSVRLVSDRLGRGANRLLDVIVWTLSTTVVAWMLYASVTRAIDATERRETAFGLIDWPGWPWRWFLVAGLAAFLLVSAVNLARSVSGRIPFGDDADDQPSIVPPSAEGSDRS
ncbi:TRAP transporter small permease [Labedella phragmitis]|uniref:TRAP transporter small permease n=1 Tax=Labedella phragmitis TaxID=2498849 RepID=A0A3S3ZHL6_9MICO|nr:TRAP transporter small permease [Labedella phragmitis]RWZ46232.1 TRAP transporter small permease [Labedella phragmitis]